MGALRGDKSSGAPLSEAASTVGAAPQSLIRLGFPLLHNSGQRTLTRALAPLRRDWVSVSAVRWMYAGYP